MTPRRRKEPRIQDLATHPRRYVSPSVAAAYLEVDRKTLAKMLGVELPFSWHGRRRKIAISDLAAFERQQRVWK